MTWRAISGSPFSEGDDGDAATDYVTVLDEMREVGRCRLKPIQTRVESAWFSSSN
jgi:hypothetical protein